MPSTSNTIVTKNSYAKITNGIYFCAISLVEYAIIQNELNFSFAPVVLKVWFATQKWGVTNDMHVNL